MPKTKKTHRSKRTKSIKKAHGLGGVLRRARFIPPIAISLFATVLAWQPHALNSPTRGVLAYATNTSIAGLLSATNTQRSNNGVAALSANSLLNSAAQSKAEDMVAKNYWSHVSPDGTQPWAFISATGYQYTSAGENLAYGFLTSGDTVNGWMNSTSHRQNMLNSVFSEVGFGIANSPNFVGDGQQTVVVAMYGAPKVAGASTTQPTPTPTATPQPSTSSNQSTPKSTTPPTPAAAAPEPEPTAAPTPTESTPVSSEPIAIVPVNETVVTTATATPTKIERIKLLTNGTAIWSATAILLLVIAFSVYWGIHRGFHIRKYILAGEHFLASHHIHLDLTVLSVIYLGFVLLSASGAVR